MGKRLQLVVLGGAFTLLFFQNCGRATVYEVESSLASLSLAQSQPALSNVIVGNSNLMNGLSAERVIPAGQTVHIRWTLNLPKDTVGTPSIKLAYFTDDNLQTVFVDNLVNGSNFGCEVNDGGSADDNATGCYAWLNGSPHSSYYRIRVTVSGIGPNPVSSESLPVNASGIQILAGNTSRNIGESVGTAILVNDTRTNAFTPDHQSFTVDANGKVYFRDINAGVLTFSVDDPNDRNVKVLIPLGAKDGEQGNGPITTAKLRQPLSLTTDNQNRLLILDHDRIRRVDFSTNPATITTIIGGGSDTADTVANPLHLKINPVSYGSEYNVGDTRVPLRMLPNGDIFFFSELHNIYSNKRIRYYSAANNTVSSIKPSGDFILGDTGINVAMRNCGIAHFHLAYNPNDTATGGLSDFLTATSTYNACGMASNVWRHEVLRVSTTGAVSITTFPQDGMAVSIDAKDGHLYRLNRHTPVLQKWNGTTWVTLLGSGVPGSCVDGTQANICNFFGDSAFVDRHGTPFFMDRGRLRHIVDNRVYTVGGQGYSFGDGGSALNARFGMLTGIQKRSDGGLIVLDVIENRFRQFYRGGLIATIAGDGGNATPNLTQPATSQPFRATFGWEEFSNFVVDKTNNDIIYPRAPKRISRILNRSNLWQDFLGGGSIPYRDMKTGDDASAMALNGYALEPMLIASNGTETLYSILSYDGVKTFDAMLFSINEVTKKVTKIVGPTNSGEGYCPVNTLLENCQNLPIFSRGVYRTMGGYDSATGSWLLISANQKSVYKVKAGGKLEIYASLEKPATAFQLVSFQSKPYLFYCDQNSGFFRRKNMATGTETELTWPISGMKCTGRSFVYDSANSSLVFIYEKNALTGVAELFSVAP